MVVAMFNLTKQEQRIVAVLVGALLLGTLVRVWRQRVAVAASVANVRSRGQ